MAKDRIYVVRKPYKGDKEYDDAKKLAKDVQKDLKEIEKVSRKTDKDLTEVKETADAAAARTIDHQQDGASKTDAGTTFAATSWADLPGNGGTGNISVTITTSGGKVRASACTSWDSNINNVLTEIRIKEDATGGSVVAHESTPNAGNKMNICVEEIFSPAAGSHTYTVQGQIPSGTAPDLDNVHLSVQEIKAGS